MDSMQKIAPGKLARLQDILDEMVADRFVSGASCMVLQHGRELCYYESGYRDIAGKKPISRDTIFRFYSMTKPVTAVAVMMLVEEGRLDLLAPVYDFFPEFQDQYYIRDGKKISVQTPVQIRHLLNMTAGLSYPGGSADETDAQTDALIREIIAKLDTDAALSTQEVVGRIGKIPLLFEPGMRWNYGLCADVLGAVVEKISGMRFGQFLEQRIFEPLQMADTGFFVPGEKQSRLAKVYDWDEQAGALAEREPNHLGIATRMAKAPAFESGGAGLAGTINDAAKFASMLTARGKTEEGVKLISEKTWEYMISAGLTDAQRAGIVWESLPGYSYGNLMRILEEPGRAVSFGSKGEYGWDGWLGAYMMNDPVNELTLLIMNQRMNTGTTRYTRKMRNILFSALETLVPLHSQQQIMEVGNEI